MTWQLPRERWMEHWNVGGHLYGLFSIRYQVAFSGYAFAALGMRIPAGFKLKSAEVAGQPAQALTEGELVRLAWNPTSTAEVEWKLVTSTEPL